jgi:hypothetical protein
MKKVGYTQMLKDVVIRGFIACRRETNASNIRKSGWYQ